MLGSEEGPGRAKPGSGAYWGAGCTSAYRSQERGPIKTPVPKAGTAGCNAVSLSKRQQRGRCFPLYPNTCYFLNSTAIASISLLSIAALLLPQWQGEGVAFVFYFILEAGGKPPDPQLSAGLAHLIRMPWPPPGGIAR